MKRLVLLLVAVAVLVGGGLYWKRSTAPSAAPNVAGPGKGEPRGLPVKAGTVRTGTITEEVSAVGTLLANESVMIRPERDGRIAQIHFAEGQLVKKGTKLVSLDASETEAQLAAARAEATLNRNRLKRAEELKDKNFISAEALDVARENLNQSVARQEEVKSRLEKMTILAPFEGVAGLRQVSPGAYVKAGQDIARLEGIGTLKLDFRVPELYLGRIRSNQQVQVRVDAFLGETFHGAIYAVEPSVDEQTRTVLLRALVPNPDVRLKPGMFARVLLVLGTRENALIVPEQAIVPRGNDNYVFRIVEGKAALAKVELGARRMGEVEITKGLAAGDHIVVDGQLKLKPGVPVKILSDKPENASPPGRQEAGEGGSAN
ncbi:MAG TPA: efflux RND transporter periplasmic adaptor subunit [Burkholderiales bacterium]|jgi:membrane fusion protein (multidrug efflux system)|nr:efflux RND transporter periplasmic adaptor subunit [Burkholderiales bacterium]